MGRTNILLTPNCQTAIELMCLCRTDNGFEKGNVQTTDIEEYEDNEHWCPMEKMKKAMASLHVGRCYWVFNICSVHLSLTQLLNNFTGSLIVTRTESCVVCFFVGLKSGYFLCGDDALK